MTTTPSEPSRQQAEEHAGAERHDAAAAAHTDLADRPNTEDRIVALGTAEKALRDTAVDKERDQARPEPARTAHPAGPEQAAANRENEPPA